jgi:hypothetical protein
MGKIYFKLITENTLYKTHILLFSSNVIDV